MTALIFTPTNFTEKERSYTGVLNCLERGGEFIVVVQNIHVFDLKCYLKESKAN